MELKQQFKRLECFGTATTQDACMQCPDNDECATLTCLESKAKTLGEWKTEADKDKGYSKIFSYKLIPFDDVIKALRDTHTKKEVSGNGSQ